MREIECKVLEVSVPPLTRKLKALGAKYKGTKTLTAVHLDTPDRFFFKKRWLVRLRTDGGPAVLTIKSNISKKGIFKSADEREITLSDFKSSLRVLSKMGLEVTFGTVKTRSTYELNGIKFEIDKYKKEYSHIPAFLEIEATSKPKVLWAAKKLGYSSKHLKSYNVHDLIRHYSKLRR